MKTYNLMRNRGLVLTFFRFRACPSNIHIQEVIITHKINEERKKMVILEIMY